MTSGDFDDEKPLIGRTVLVTRPEEQSVTEKEKLQALGAKVLEYPTIEITSPSSYVKLDQALDEIENFNWIIFTSPNGVKNFFHRARSKDNLVRTTKKMKGIKFACVGPSTSKSLFEEAQISADFIPREYLTRSLGQELPRAFSLEGRRILLVRVEDANIELATTLTKAGATVFEAPAYRTLVRKSTGKTNELLHHVTDITFTSPSTVGGFLAAFKAEEVRERRIAVHVIGPVTAESARERGLTPSSVAKVHTLDGLITSITEFCKQEREVRRP